MPNGTFAPQIRINSVVVSLFVVEFTAEYVGVHNMDGRDGQLVAFLKMAFSVAGHAGQAAQLTRALDAPLHNPF